MPPEDREQTETLTEETLPSEDRDREKTGTLTETQRRQCHQRTETETLTETQRDAATRGQRQRH